MLERRGVDEQGIGPLPVGERPHVCEVDLLRPAQILDQRARGGDRRWVAVEPKPLEAAHAKLVEQCPPRRFPIEGPRVRQRDR